ncbi:hypothetical protein ACFRAR_29045 [Kitasatospora sp. NPDC056651]|uniref:hypothetical protein n=1 Tax=Kitasatospora sp. NPDC056651 TaxID=3345892 RepID=UPI0036CDF1F3
MGAVGADEAVAAPGLRIAVDFYAAKAEELQLRQAALEDELATLRSELARVSGTRDQLADVLAELLVGQSQEDPAEPGPTAAEESGPGVAEEPSSVPPSEPAPPRRSAGRRGAQSGEVMQAVLMVLVTAGRPMRVREITEAIGRPASGKEGRAPQETTRSTCKRLVQQGKAVEGPVGVFAIARSGEPSAEGAA